MKLNDQKNDFLQQAKSENCESWSMKEFQDQFDTWEDLKVEDFKDIPKLSEIRFGYFNPCYWINHKSAQIKEYLDNGNIRYTIIPAV